MQNKKNQRSKRKGAEKEFWPLQQVLGLWWKLSLDDSKGVYPCKYMDGWEKSEETKLQPKNTFYSKLNKKGKSDNEYKHCQQVWYTIEKKGLGCSHNIYLITDILLLVEYLNIPFEIRT